jgi:hypothetical protein
MFKSHLLMKFSLFLNSTEMPLQPVHGLTAALDGWLPPEGQGIQKNNGH